MYQLQEARREVLLLETARLLIVELYRVFMGTLVAHNRVYLTESTDSSNLIYYGFILLDYGGVADHNSALYDSEALHVELLHLFTCDL